VRDVIGPGDGPPFRQIQVAAHVKAGGPPGLLDRVLERCAVRQERRAGHNPIRASLDNAPVHSVRVTKVICIDDELFQAVFPCGLLQ
jgi:hypothetical protein